MERDLEPYELTEEEILGRQEEDRKEKIIEVYKNKMEDVYEILTHIEDYEADIKKMKNIIIECEKEVASLD